MCLRQITSRKNPRVKDAIKLRGRRARQRQGRFLIDGVREIQRAIDAGIELEETFVSDGFQENDVCQLLVDQLKTSGNQVIYVTEEVSRKLVYGGRDQGAVTVARTPTITLDELKLTASPMIAVLEGVEKPGNVGAILRIADAVGISALVVTGKGTDLYNPNTVRASVGTLFTVPVCMASIRETLAWLSQYNLTVVATSPDGATCYSDVDFVAGFAAVLGSEASGLSPAWEASGITSVRVPMQGVGDSLNVAATAAVIFYESLRQRGTVEREARTRPP